MGVGEYSSMRQTCWDSADHQEEAPSLPPPQLPPPARAPAPMPLQEGFAWRRGVGAAGRPPGVWGVVRGVRGTRGAARRGDASPGSVGCPLEACAASTRRRSLLPLPPGGRGDGDAAGCSGVCVCSQFSVRGQQEALCDGLLPCRGACGGRANEPRAAQVRGLGVGECKPWRSAVVGILAVQVAEQRAAAVQQCCCSCRRHLRSSPHSPPGGSRHTLRSPCLLPPASPLLFRWSTASLKHGASRSSCRWPSCCRALSGCSSRPAVAAPAPATLLPHT